MSFKRLLRSFNKGILILLALGLIAICASVGDILMYMKPSHSFEELMENGVEKGLHVRGEVPFTYDCFAEEETYRKNKTTGSRTAGRTSSYYYAIPVTGDYVVGLEVNTEDYDSMEQLLNETVEYLDGGDYPSTAVSVDGGVKEMKSELQELFDEYLLEVGYTQDELDAMGTPLVIEQPNSKAVSIGIGVFGIAAFAAGIFFWVVTYKKLVPSTQADGEPVMM